MGPLPFSWYSELLRINCSWYQIMARYSQVCTLPLSSIVRGICSMLGEAKKGKPESQARDSALGFVKTTDAIPSNWNSWFSSQFFTINHKGIAYTWLA